MEKLVQLETFTYRHEAEYIKSLLESEGIVSMVLADDIGGMRPDLAFGMGGVRLMVKKSDFDKAKQILSLKDEEPSF